MKLRLVISTHKDFKCFNGIAHKSIVLLFEKNEASVKSNVTYFYILTPHNKVNILTFNAYNEYI